MTAPAALSPGQDTPERSGSTPGQLHLACPAHEPGARADQSLAAHPQRTSTTRPQAPAGRARPVRAWQILVLALPAAVATWSGWVGIGQMTGFGIVRPLPGIWDALHLNTAITLPIGVESYAAYALRAWLSPATVTASRTRRFARGSAIASLLLGMAGQVAYHLLGQAHINRAPWPVTTAVSCLPVLVLGMGAALAHLLHADATTPPSPASPETAPATRPARPGADQPADTVHLHRMTAAEQAAARLAAAGHDISRRNLRAAGITGSNASLGKLATTLKTHIQPHLNLATTPTPATQTTADTTPGNTERSQSRNPNTNETVLPTRRSRTVR
jgi:hypothetical protein